MNKLEIRTFSGASIKPVRVLWHTVPGLVIVAVMLRTYPSIKLPIVALSIAVFVLAVADLLRFTTTFGERFFWKHLAFLTSGKERRGPNASLYYALSLLVSICVFPPRIAMGSIICLAVGDTVAGIVGKLFGKCRLRDKSIEGAVANFIVCYLILRFIVPSTMTAFIGAFIGALVELVPIPIDDNIAIPLASGLAMVVVGRM